MLSKQRELEAGISALEAQRALLGNAVVDASIAGLRAKLATLSPDPAPDAAPTRSLRQVSILFLDVVGSTTLSQSLDPEAISAVMDDALSRGTAIVERHRGKVLQYAGDSLLAAFGAEGVLEDDAERAVHCGLALLELGRTLGAEIHARHGRTGFDVRVGIHTGDVLLGGGVDAEGTIRGMAVNIAARMEQTAPTARIRISQDTYAQVRGVFEVDEQELLAVKGVDAPLRTYLVRRARPRPLRVVERGIAGVTTRMIGRDAELDQLKTAFKSVFLERKFAAITVVAEAGIGKSRLLCEFAAWSEARPERFCLFRGRATPQTGTQGYGLLRDIIAWRFQIADDDSVESARKKMEDGVVPLFVETDGPDLAEGHAHLLGHLIGIEWQESRHLRGILDDPKQIKNRAFHAAAQIFRRISATNDIPVMVQIEDLHWADNESLDFLIHLTEVNQDVPLLMLSSTRPTLFERRTVWGCNEGTHQRIDLQPLDKTGSQLLANELLRNLGEVPEILRQLLTGGAEGNPFYMEEMVRMLIDQGAIQAGDTWSVNAERLLVTRVPPTLTGVLQARLDQLPALERRALQLASVVGAVFWDQALAAIEARAAEQLPALVQRELAIPRALGQLDSIREFSFRHHLLHQVTYGTVLKRDKRDVHARVAQWLASLTERGGLRAGDFVGLAAEHFEQAGDGASAAKFHARAAEQAGQRLAHERVLIHAGRALALLGEASAASFASQSEIRWRLLSVRERTFSLLALRDEQAADLDSLTQLAEQLDDPLRLAEVSRRRCIRAMRTADWAAMEGAARHCMQCADQAGDVRMELVGLRLLAAAKISQGENDIGQALAQRGLTEARRLGYRKVESMMLNALSVAAEMRGDIVGGLELNRQSLLVDRETGDRVSEALGLSRVGGSLLFLGDFAQARRDLEAALEMLRTNGDRVMEGGALENLSTLALWEGDKARALALARQAVDIAVAAHARDKVVSAELSVGDAEAALGRIAAARQAYTEARTHALEIGNAGHHFADAGLARAALAEGDTGAAMAALQSLLAHLPGRGAPESAAACWLHLTCYEVLARAADPRAADWLAKAYTALMATAEAISDTKLRRGFLNNIPYHREIVAEWAKIKGEVSDTRGSAN